MPAFFAPNLFVAICVASVLSSSFLGTWAWDPDTTSRHLNYRSLRGFGALQEPTTVAAAAVATTTNSTPLRTCIPADVSTGFPSCFSGQFNKVMCCTGGFGYGSCRLPEESDVSYGKRCLRGQDWFCCSEGN
eukprot:jgi/Botrbrau1/7028/Bobra.0165s0053.1